MNRIAVGVVLLALFAWSTRSFADVDKPGNYKTWPKPGARLSVRYTVEKSLTADPGLIAALRRAINEWTTLLGFVDFVDVTGQKPLPKDYISFEPGADCKATRGFLGGAHVIYLRGCNREWAAMAHEIGHTLGLPHEHQRPSRDGFVTINRLALNDLGKTQVLELIELSSLRKKRHDLLSVMHYALEQRGLTKNGEVVMFLDDEGKRFLKARKKSEDDIRTAINEPTACDVVALKHLYGMPTQDGECFQP